MNDGRRFSRRWRAASLLALGALIGILVAATPAGAHFRASIDHIWSHIKPKADKRYVNVNEKAQLGIVRASKDSTPGGTDLAASGRVEVNSVSINTPKAGVLIISGHAFVNSDEGAATSYVLVPKVDGASVSAPGWGSTLFAGADLQATERFELSYTTVRSVAAGAHTVTQDVGPFGGTADFFYNNNDLVVQWVPSAGSQAVVSRPVARTSNTRSRMGN
jgi:hypothetical protein